jgi:hypothetical protein
MKVEFETEEGWNLMSHVVSQLIETAELSDSDRAKIRRWKSDEMRVTSQEMKVLTAKINEDLAKSSERKSRSGIIKPDWR